MFELITTVLNKMANAWGHEEINVLIACYARGTEYGETAVREPGRIGGEKKQRKGREVGVLRRRELFINVNGRSKTRTQNAI